MKVVFKWIFRVGKWLCYGIAGLFLLSLILVGFLAGGQPKRR